LAIADDDRCYEYEALLMSSGLLGDFMIPCLKMSLYFSVMKVMKMGKPFQEKS
jgi:hypothetical protein